MILSTFNTWEYCWDWPSYWWSINDLNIFEQILIKNLINLFFKLTLIANVIVLVNINAKIRYSKYWDVTNHQTLYWIRAVNHILDQIINFKLINILIIYQILEIFQNKLYYFKIIFKGKFFLELKLEISIIFWSYKSYNWNWFAEVSNVFNREFQFPNFRIDF
jgi:hypothetical protein